MRSVTLSFACNNACIFCAQGGLREARPSPPIEATNPTKATIPRAEGATPAPDAAEVIAKTVATLAPGETVALLGGVHVCLRKVEAQAILAAMREHGVDHYCAAPIVHNLLISAPAEWRAGITQQVRGMVAGAAPPAAMIEGMAKIGFDITHVYGLTEVYGPAAVAVKHESWAAQSLSELSLIHISEPTRPY